MFIQGSKAKLFNDIETHKNIMASSSPSKMRTLGSKVKNFNSGTGEKPAFIKL